MQPLAANMYVLNILHYQLCYTSGLHHNLTILLSASLSNLQRIRRNFSGEDVTASKALVCRTPQARHAPPTQDDGHPMPPVSPVCHRRPVIAVNVHFLRSIPEAQLRILSFAVNSGVWGSDTRRMFRELCARRAL